MKINFSKIKKCFALCLCVVFSCVALSGCSLATSVSLLNTSVDSAGLVTIEDGGVPLAGGTKVLKPESPGTATYAEAGPPSTPPTPPRGISPPSTAAAVKSSCGSPRAAAPPTPTTSTPTASMKCFPCTAGDGTYKIELFKNVSGTQYSSLMSESIPVTLRSSTLPFLYPSQYVNFNQVNHRYQRAIPCQRHGK